MKVVTYASFKGGAGKSTAAMATCSSWLAKGMRVAMTDADENVPLLEWQERSRRQGCWDEACSVVRGDDLRSLERAYEAAERDDTDVAIIDTRGGGSELNNACVTNADVVVIPTALTGLDIAAALSTFEYVLQLLHDARLSTPVVLLVQRVPVGKLTVSQVQDLGALSTLPRCEPVLHARDAFAAMSKRGMLHVLHRAMATDPRLRLTASHVGVALGEASTVRADLDLHMGGR